VTDAAGNQFAADLGTVLVRNHTAAPAEPRPCSQRPPDLRARPRAGLAGMGRPAPPCDHRRAGSPRAHPRPRDRPARPRDRRRGTRARRDLRRSAPRVDRRPHATGWALHSIHATRPVAHAAVRVLRVRRLAARPPRPRAAPARAPLYPSTPICCRSANTSKW
jgi:hypothetical protein